MTDEPKGDILEEAINVVRERENTHGGVYENHKHIADMWSGFLGIEIEAWEVAAMMTMLKWSRAKIGSHERDHFVDVAGYADCAYVCTQHEESETQSKPALCLNCDWEGDFEDVVGTKDGSMCPECRFVGTVTRNPTIT